MVKHDYFAISLPTYRLRLILIGHAAPMLRDRQCFYQPPQMLAGEWRLDGLSCP